MYYKISKNLIVDSHGLRVLRKGKPINYDGLDLEKIDEVQIIRASKYISQLKQAKRINYDVSSYGLKHNAEEYLRKECGKDGDYYISNGAFISAMLLGGFNYRIADMLMEKTHLEESFGFLTSVNMYFNIYLKDLKKLK